MDDDTLAEVGVAIFGALVFIAILVAVGTTFGDGGLSRQGGYALVGGIGFFIVLMSLLGYWLSTRSA